MTSSTLFRSADNKLIWSNCNNKIQREQSIDEEEQQVQRNQLTGSEKSTHLRLPKRYYKYRTEWSKQTNY